MDQAGEAGADQPGADRNRADAMPAQLIPSERGCSKNSRPASPSPMLDSACLRRHASPSSMLATPTGFEPVALRLGI